MSFHKARLEKVIFPIPDFQIHARAFCESALTSVHIPSSWNLSFEEFSDCRNLVDISFENPDMELDDCGMDGTEAFLRCENIVFHTLRGSKTEQYALKHNISHTVFLAPGTQELEPYAFYNRLTLLEVTLPDTLVSIDDSAFEGCCGLRKIMIPPSVTRIGHDAFLGCHKAVLYIRDNPYAEDIAERFGLEYVRC